jgi:phage-related protein
MLIWSAAGILEKNKLANDKPFLVLIQLTVKESGEVVKLVRNNENVTWNNDEWIRFPVDFDKVTEDGKSLPSVALKISNVKGLIQSYVQTYKGFCDSQVKIIIVHAAHLDNTTPELELDFVINSTKYDEQWITFTIGASNDHSFRFPVWRYMNKFCNYHYKDIQCGYYGTATACDNTLSTCRISTRFGGEPGLEAGT